MTKMLLRTMAMFAEVQVAAANAPAAARDARAALAQRALVLTTMREGRNSRCCVGLCK